jgi:hypothetical protein
MECVLSAQRVLLAWASRGHVATGNSLGGERIQCSAAISSPAATKLLLAEHSPRLGVSVRAIFDCPSGTFLAAEAWRVKPPAVSAG